MRLQDTAAGCGPASMSNALASLGIRRNLSECEALCKCTGTAGTSPANLLRALATVEDVEPATLAEIREDVAVLRLAAALSRGRPAILCVDGSSHWVAAVGTLGQGRVLVADSADNELVLSLTWEELAARWVAPTRTKYYGVIL